MYDLFFDVFTSSNFLASAVEFESTLIIARYLSIICSIGVFFGCFVLIYIFFKIIINAFRG